MSDLDDLRMDDLEHLKNVIRTSRKRVQALEEEYFRTLSIELKMQLDDAKQQLGELWDRYEEAAEAAEPQLVEVGVPIAPERIAFAKLAEPAQLFSFANRERELTRLMAPEPAASLFLVEAPAGQGKTYLLKRMLAGFGEKPQTRTFYLDMHTFVVPETELLPHQTELLWHLLSSLDPPRSRELSKSMSLSRFMRILITVCNDEDWDLTVLVFDGVECLQEQFAEWFCNEVMYPLAMYVPKERIRIVVAGRYIASNWLKGTGSHLWNYPPLVLSAFDQKVIVGVILDYARSKGLPLQHSLKAQNALAHEVYKIAGGHPEFIIKVLAEIQQDGLLAMNPDIDYYRRYFREEEQRIFQQVVRPDIDKIFDDMQGDANKLRRAFEVISIFRYFNITTLEVLIKRNFLQNYRGEDELLEALCRTRLVEMAEDVALYRDLAIRNLLANFLRFEHRKRFKELNELAVEMFEKWSQGYLIEPERKMQIPPRGDYQMQLVIEGIYHKLILLEFERQDEEHSQVSYAMCDKIKGMMTNAINFLDWSDLEASQGLLRFRRRLEHDYDIMVLLTELLGEKGVELVLRDLNNDQLASASNCRNGEELT